MGGFSFSCFKTLLHLVKCDEYQDFPYHQIAWTRWALAHNASFFSVLIWKENTIIIDCFEIFIERPSNLLARAQTFLSMTKVFYPAGNTTNKLFDMFRENWKNPVYWQDDRGLCSPYKSFPICCSLWVSPSAFIRHISLQTWVRQNWYLILRQSYVWYCTVMASPCNNTSQKHSNVEWSETIQNLAMSFITFFLEFQHSSSLSSIFKALASGLSCFHCII